MLHRTSEPFTDAPSIVPPSLQEVHRSVRIPAAASAGRRLFAFVGPGYLVAVGYMDPGNWATSLAGDRRTATRCCRWRCSPR